MQKNNRNYRKSEIQTEMIGQFAGKGLLTTNGSYWLRQRRLIQPGFHRQKLSALSDIMLKVVNDSLDDLDTYAATNQAFDISDEMTKLAFKIVAKSLFTTSVSEEELMTLANNIQELQEYIVRRIRQPYLIPWFHLSGKHKKQFEISEESRNCLLYTSPSPRDATLSRMPSSA